MELRKQVRDPVAMRTGEWQPLGPEYGGIEVKVRAMAGAYTDDLANRRRALARQHGGIDSIPTDAESKAITEAVIKTVLIDVRGGKADTLDGEPVALENFSELLREGGAVSLVNAIMQASARVGHVRESDAAEAVGN